MDEEKLARINSFLSKNNASIDTLSKSKLNQLDKVDSAIQVRLNKIDNAREIIKSNAINVSTISIDTNISRKTFYNNDLLKLYVKYYATECDDKNTLENDFDKIKEDNNILIKQINDFVMRDIDTENLRHENDELNREIINLQNRNQSLESEYEELQKEISILKRTLVEKNINVIAFPSDKKIILKKIVIIYAY